MCPRARTWRLSTSFLATVAKDYSFTQVRAELAQLIVASSEAMFTCSAQIFAMDGNFGRRAGAETFACPQR